MINVTGGLRVARTYEKRKESNLMDIKQESLQKHYEWNGKIEVISRCEVNDRHDLSLAYTPALPRLVSSSTRT